jgi:hypothetical protein
MSTRQDKEIQEALRKRITVLSLMLRVHVSTELLPCFKLVCKRLADYNSPTGWLSPDELEKTYYNTGKGVVLFLPKYNTET